MRYYSLVVFCRLSFSPKALNVKVLSMSPQRKQNVLVFPCGSEIGLELYRSLSTSTHVRLWGGSSVPDHGEFVYERYIKGMPYVADPMFIDAVNHIVDEKGIDFLIPAHDSVVLSSAENAKHLHCRVLGSPTETYRICRSKRLTCKTFASLLRVQRMRGGFLAKIQKNHVEKNKNSNMGS